jgi:hypothetical protein
MTIFFGAGNRFTGLSYRGSRHDGGGEDIAIFPGSAKQVNRKAICR